MGQTTRRRSRFSTMRMEDRYVDLWDFDGVHSPTCIATLHNKFRRYCGGLYHLSSVSYFLIDFMRKTIAAVERYHPPVGPSISRPESHFPALPFRRPMSRSISMTAGSSTPHFDET